MSDNFLNSAEEYNTLEKVGIFALPFFVTGFAFYLTGSAFYLYDNWASPLQDFYYFLLNLLLPLLLIIVPFSIQVPIFIKFLRVYKYEIRPSAETVSIDERGLSVFFKYYCWFMCVGLIGYSICWFLYNTSFVSWRSFWLTSTSVLSLLFVVLLIWIIGICTQIIIRGGKSDGLLKPNDLSTNEYKELCERLNAILVNGDVLKNNEFELRRIITSRADADEEKRQKIKNIINVFSNRGVVNLPITRNNQQVDDLISILTDKREPARIKPLVRILSILDKQADDTVHRAIIEKEFSSKYVTKRQLIKSLNKILMNYDFYEKEFFSSGNERTPIVSAAEYFGKNKRSVHYSSEKVQVENRRLFDAHVLPFLTDKNAKLDPELLQDQNARYTSFATKNVKGSIFRFRLNDYKERKIVEGIARFPFYMLLFFFTIFLCIVYLFAFSFAFHDLSTLKDSKTKTPALFMAAEYSNSNSDFNVEPDSDSKTQPNLEAKAEMSKKPTFFFFYTLANSGTEYKSDGGQEQDLQSQRYIANKQSLDSFLKIIKKEAPSAKRIFVEIVGRTDDTPINKLGDVSSRQTYSSNYDLSLARAQNLKFDLMQRLQRYPGILEKIEWSCLPVSNDASLKREFPLDNSGNKPSIALKETAKPEDAANNSLNAGELKERIKNSLENPLNEVIQDIENQVLNDQLLIKKAALQQHIAKAISLLDTPGSIPNRNSGNFLYSGLNKEYQSYLAIKDGPANDSKPEMENYNKKLEEFDELSQKIESALVFFASESDQGNKRITEVYVTSVPYVTPSNSLNLLDYILYSITAAGYGDIKPTTLYAKFLSVLVNLVEIFFVVVFFNALLSVKRVGEEEGGFNSLEASS